jgi:2-oxoglutarate ferredoxin oxidoreductase subunit alpha
VSWGGTYGAVRTAAEHLVESGNKIGHMHMRWMHPFPRNVGEILKRFTRILVCELNMGQLQFLLQGRFGVETIGLHKVRGKPFMVNEIIKRVEELLGGK